MSARSTTDVLSFEFADFERAAAGLEDAARQVPFALARAMNDATAAARKELVEQTWPTHIRARNKSFLGAALRREFARKTDLRAAIVESGPAAGRGNLSLHQAGGARQARHANLAIPSEALKARRTGKGVPQGMRPGSLPNTFRRGDTLYQRIGKYQKGAKGARGKDNRHLKLVYILKPSAPIRADVPFAQDFQRVMSREVWRAFTPRLAAALATRRR